MHTLSIETTNEVSGFGAHVRAEEGGKDSGIMLTTVLLVRGPRPGADVHAQSTPYLIFTGIAKYHTDRPCRHLLDIQWTDGHIF